MALFTSSLVNCLIKYFNSPIFHQHLLATLHFLDNQVNDQYRVSAKNDGEMYFDQLTPDGSGHVQILLMTKSMSVCFQKFQFLPT